jgi:hypothetical protein
MRISRVFRVHGPYRSEEVHIMSQLRIVQVVVVLAAVAALAMPLRGGGPCPNQVYSFDDCPFSYLFNPCSGRSLSDCTGNGVLSRTDRFATDPQSYDSYQGLMPGTLVNVQCYKLCPCVWNSMLDECDTDATNPGCTTTPAPASPPAPCS